MQITVETLGTSLSGCVFEVPVAVPSFSYLLHLYAGHLKNHHHHHHLEPLLLLLLFYYSDRGLLHIHDQGHLMGRQDKGVERREKEEDQMKKLRSLLGLAGTSEPNTNSWPWPLPDPSLVTKHVPLSPFASKCASAVS